MSTFKTSLYVILGVLSILMISYSGLYGGIFFGIIGVVVVESAISMWEAYRKMVRYAKIKEHIFVVTDMEESREALAHIKNLEVEFAKSGEEYKVAKLTEDMLIESGNKFFMDKFNENPIRVYKCIYQAGAFSCETKKSYAERLFHFVSDVRSRYHDEFSKKKDSEYARDLLRQKEW